MMYKLDRNDNEVYKNNMKEIKTIREGWGGKEKEEEEVEVEKVDFLWYS